MVCTEQDIDQILTGVYAGDYAGKWKKIQTSPLLSENRGRGPGFGRVRGNSSTGRQLLTNKTPVLPLPSPWMPKRHRRGVGLLRICAIGKHLFTNQIAIVLDDLNLFREIHFWHVIDWKPPSLGIFAFGFTKRLV